ncbi:MAG TPA: KH domain-containing protein [Acidimicrobiales bacterium]|nr:KH domain-containing protein [Acidimicrobiales bacterium]
MSDEVGGGNAYEADDDDDFEDDGAGNRVPAGIATAVLDYVACAIVDDPESVVVEAEEGRHGVTLRLHVAPDDMGKVIGRRGRVAQAIRSVVRAAGTRDNTNVQVDIVD